VKALHDNIPDEVLRANMRRCDKFGNDEPGADRWTDFVVREFARVLESHGQNTRGGRYVTGLYSTTTHVRFGRVTGALPNGRRRGEPFTSGMAPVNGMDKKGPTAVLNSMNRVDYAMCPNGVNFNIKFASSVLAGKRGAAILQSLMQTYFGRGGMQAQLNVLDSETLKRAKAEPEMFPNLLVRVSGYSAYFNDLSGPMQDEIIARTANELG
jgi:pyruvate-formate lyase